MFVFEGKGMVESLGLTSTIYLKMVSKRHAIDKQDDKPHNVIHPYTTIKLLDKSIETKTLDANGYTLVESDTSAVARVAETQIQDSDTSKSDDSVEVCEKLCKLQKTEMPLYVTRCALTSIKKDEYGYTISPTLVLETAGLLNTTNIELQLVNTLQKFVDEIRHRLAKAEDVFNLHSSSLELKGAMKLHVMPNARAQSVMINFEIRNHENDGKFLQFIDNNMEDTVDVDSMLMMGLLHKNSYLVDSKYDMRDLPTIHFEEYMRGLDYMFENIFTTPAYLLVREQPEMQISNLFNAMHFPVGGRKHTETLDAFQERISSTPFASILSQQSVAVCDATKGKDKQMRYMTELSHMSIVIELQKQACKAQDTFAYNFLKCLISDIKLLFMHRQKIMPATQRVGRLEYGGVATPQDSSHEIWTKYKRRYLSHGTSEMNLFCLGLAAISCAIKQSLLSQDQPQLLRMIDTLASQMDTTFANFCSNVCSKLCSDTIPALEAIMLKHSGGAAATLSLATLSMMSISKSLYKITIYRKSVASLYKPALKTL